VNLNHKIEKEARDKKIVIRQKPCEAKWRKGLPSKRPVRTLTVHQLPGLGHWQDVHLARGYSRSCSDHRSNRAQGSEQFLIVRGVCLVYVREHRSNVRTIEQILFKYSRKGQCYLNGLYRLCKFFFIQYGLYGKREGHSIPSAFLQVQRERSIRMWLTQFFIFQKLVTRPTIPFSFLFVENSC